MDSDLRLVHLARMLSLERATLSFVEGRAAIGASPGAFATALVAEAADNDDVTSREAAIEYIEGRLTFFQDLVSDAEAVRREFEARLANW